MNVRRRASAALISSWVYKLSAGKGCLESLEDVVSAAGEAGSVTSEGDQIQRAQQVPWSHPVVSKKYIWSSGSNPPSGDPDGGNTNSGRFLWTRISKISGAITRIHNAVR